MSREKRDFLARRKLISGVGSPVDSTGVPAFPGSRKQLRDRIPDLSADFRRRKVAFSRWGHVRGEDGAFRLQLFPRSSAQFAQQKFQPRLCLEFLIGAFASIQFEKLLISGGRFGLPS